MAVPATNIHQGQYKSCTFSQKLESTDVDVELPKTKHTYFMEGISSESNYQFIFIFSRINTGTHTSNDVFTYIWLVEVRV